MNKIFKKIKEEVLGSCKKCSAKGWYYDDKELQQPCVCMNELMAIAACDKGNVPIEYWKWNFENWRGEQVISLPNTFSTPAGWSYVFSGKYRVGKTTLAVCLAKCYNKLYKDTSIFYTTARDLESSTFKKDDDTESLCHESDFLIIDDLGKETTFSSNDPNKRKIRNVLDEVIRHRRGCKPTIITTNLNFDMIKEHYGSNLAIIFHNDFNYVAFPETAKMLNTK